MPALRLVDLRLPFGEAGGLEPLSLEVAEGERLVIVGASGAGKTTLLRGIAGLGPVAGGRVEIGGRDVTRTPAERRDAVYLHQTPLLFPHLSVGENIAFPLRVRGVPDAEARRRVEELLAAVRLEGYAGRRPTTLSGGQRHRVALARAVAARPTLLLLDEPLASLDPALREEVRGAIVEIQRAHRAAMVLVTHDLDEAGLLGDRVGVLLDRRLAQVAPPEQLFRAPASLAVARFLGFPNQLPGRARADGSVDWLLGVLHPPRPAPPGPVVLVFRPDALAVAAGGVEGRVVGVLHRAERTTARVRVEGAELEVAMPRDEPAAVGDRVALRADPSRILVFPG